MPASFRSPLENPQQLQQVPVQAHADRPPAMSDDQVPPFSLGKEGGGMKWTSSVLTKIVAMHYTTQTSRATTPRHTSVGGANLRSSCRPSTYAAMRLPLGRLWQQ
ncbi:unnamed protein product [Phytophthora lilii]|uniref:Unnamed protein product n=1 Tax=Phytophthora lilii TaxID=2077276 RepID=A0A9W6TNW1_9STRA|nr:unnamed protein product [Phytophthora lilii]